MKKYIIFTAVLSFFLLSGCIQKSDVKGEFDIKGTVTDVSKDGRGILVEDEKLGLIWLTLPKGSDINTFEKWSNGGRLDGWTN